MEESAELSILLEICQQGKKTQLENQPFILRFNFCNSETIRTSG
jgi:hypothetical protein